MLYLAAKRSALEVEGRQRHLGVVDLDDVDAVQVVHQRLVRRGGAQRVERMRHVHEGALLLDARERLVEAQLGRYPLLQEQPDDLALPGLDLLRHDDERIALGQFAGPQGALDLVVVGDGDGAQADLPGGADDGLHGVLGVLGEGGVHVQVGVDPVRPGRAGARPPAPTCGATPPRCRAHGETEWPPASCLPPGRRLRRRWCPGRAPPAVRRPPPWSRATPPCGAIRGGAGGAPESSAAGPAAAPEGGLDGRGHRGEVVGREDAPSEVTAPAGPALSAAPAEAR